MKRTLTTAVLCCLLLACGGSKLDRVIAAVDGAPLLVDTFNLTPDAKARVNGGFAAAGACLRAYRADTSKASVLQTCVAGVVSSGVFSVEDPVAKARINAVLYLVRVIVGLPEAGDLQRAVPSGRVEISDEQVKDLERALRP